MLKPKDPANFAVVRLLSLMTEILRKPNIIIFIALVSSITIVRHISPDTLSIFNLLWLVGVISVSTTYTFGIGALVSCLLANAVVLSGVLTNAGATNILGIEYQTGQILASSLYLVTLTLTMLLPYYSHREQRIAVRFLDSSHATAKFIGLSLIASPLSCAAFFACLLVQNSSTPIDVYLFWNLTIGTALSIVCITPMLATWRLKQQWPSLPEDPREYAVWTLCLLLVSLLAMAIQREYLYLTSLLLIWSTIRFSWFGAVMALAITTLFVSPQANQTAAQTIAGSGLAILLDEQLAWLLLGSTLLYFASLLGDRRRIEKDLEHRVIERTSMLDTMNRELSEEIKTRKHAETSLQKLNKRYRTLIETAGIPVVVLDNQFRIEHWNGASEATSGFRYANALGREFLEFCIPEESRNEMTWRLNKASASGINQENVECEIITSGGNRLTMLWNISHIDDKELEEHGQYLLIGQDISKIRQTQDQLHYLAHFDSLTGAANRRLFEDRCSQAIESIKRYGGQLALISLDIDHFKRINDTLGHDAGDEFLSTLVKRITACIRKQDTVARLGGDEFSILLHNINGQEGADKVARNLLAKITEPFQVQGSELVITSSIGITLCPDDNTEYGGLLKNADMAMYRAKNAGRNNIQFYSKEMNIEMQRQIRIESELQVALKEDEFELHYQPIIDTKSGEIVALEALLRWSHPENGLRYPDEFLSVADQTGLIQDIGRWAINQICQEGAHIMRHRDTDIPIAFNLTKRQYDHPGLLPMLEAACAEHEFNPRNIIIELSENTVNQNVADSISKLKSIKKFGSLITIDGFGRGISSVSQLNQLPIDIIKIDRSFIAQSMKNSQDRTIIETLLAISKQLGLKTFATGVETRQQESFLQKNGCLYAQGFLYSKALPLEELMQMTGAEKPGAEESDKGQITLPFGQDLL